MRLPGGATRLVGPGARGVLAFAFVRAHASISMMYESTYYTGYAVLISYSTVLNFILAVRTSYELATPTPPSIARKTLTQPRGACPERR